MTKQSDILCFSFANRAASNFKLVLTRTHLMIERLGHCAWGGLPEVTNCDTFPIEDIKSFIVDSRSDKAVVRLTTYSEGNESTYICRDFEQQEMAVEMSLIILLLKEEISSIA